jgi:thiamine-phosphate pyrophosphorylase
MAERCILYYITDRTAFAADEPARHRRLLEKIAEAARAGVDYIQLREKDLPTRELESLARDAVNIVARARADNPESKTQLLINSRTDVALAVGADGVHLRSDDVSPQEVDGIWKKCSADTPFDKLGARETSEREPQIGVSCHSPEDVARAASSGATFAVFGPVFEKKNLPETHPAGLAQLRKACATRIPVLALGGVTLSNARSCLEAGATGIAAIRLFQENDIARLAEQLRVVTSH